MRSLSERTQGWPAALYLAGLSASADLEANFGWAPGDGLALAEYLRDEVLSALPQTLMRVARRSSVLEELSPSACDAVLKRHGSARDLTELANRLQLLRPVDAGLSRYRWHPLVREALLNELRMVEPDARAHPSRTRQRLVSRAWRSWTARSCTRVTAATQSAPASCCGR